MNFYLPLHKKSISMNPSLHLQTFLTPLLPPSLKGIHSPPSMHSSLVEHTWLIPEINVKLVAFFAYLFIEDEQI